VSVRGVGTFVGLLFLGLLIVSGLMLGMFKLLEAYATSKEAKPLPMARSEMERLPPAGVPRLQGAPDHRSLDDPNLIFEKKEPTLEWDALRAKFKYDLETTAEINPGAGMWRVPIADAKKKLLEKGLPTSQTSPGNAADAEGISLPTFSSAGRQAEKREKWMTTGGNAQPAASNEGSHGTGENKH
jgi:hypothetical protein